MVIEVPQMVRRFRRFQIFQHKHVAAAHFELCLAEHRAPESRRLQGLLPQRIGLGVIDRRNLMTQMVLWNFRCSQGGCPVRSEFVAGGLRERQRNECGCR